MGITFVEILSILGALAFFIFGMKTMSEGIQKAAGSQLRNILRSMTQNRFTGVLSGFLITAIIQSSSATTVMTVSFVNAGLMTLIESAGIMMGANIGTTVTGWLVSLFGLGKFSLSAYSLPIIAIGFPMMFMKRGKLKFWGEFLIGFAILFMGLSLLKHNVQDIINVKKNPELFHFLADYANAGILSRIVFVFIGALLTIVVQSSSASMSLTIVLCHQGFLPLDVAAAMILGENIGTTITAELASMIGNVHAKRSARIHSLFNIIGVVWMIIMLPYVITFLEGFTANLFAGMDLGGHLSNEKAIVLSAFHTIFNFMNVILLIGFVPFIVNVAIKMVKSKGEEDEVHKLEYIGAAITTPEIAILEAHKEMMHFGKVAAKIPKFARKALEFESAKSFNQNIDKISKYEKITDDIEVELAKYLAQIANKEMTSDTSIKMKNYLRICSDLERVGDIYFQMSKNLEKMEENKLEFPASAKKKLYSMFDLVDKALVVMNDNLAQPHTSDVTQDAAQNIENEINALRKELRKENLNMIATKQVSVEENMAFNTIVGLNERAADHIMNVTEALTENY